MKCELSNEELVSKVKDWVSKLAKSGGQAWSLRVPVDFNNDPDMLIIELCNRLSSPPPSDLPVRFAEWISGEAWDYKGNGFWTNWQTVEKSSQELYTEFIKSLKK